MRSAVTRFAAALLVYAACGCGPVVAADRALLVGINDYSASRFEVHGRVDKVADLHGTHNDLADIRNMLQTSFGFADSDILELRDTEATHRGILNAIDDWLIAGTQPGDRVFFHFSGHGAQIPDRDGDEQDQGDDGLDEILVAADAHCQIGTGIHPLDCRQVVVDDEIGERLERLKNRFVMVVIDSCHAGTGTRSLAGPVLAGTRLLHPASAAPIDDQRPGSRSGLSESGIDSDRSPEFLSALPNRVALFAVDAYQTAPEMLDENNRIVGLFSSRLSRGVTEGLADLNRDGAVSFEELLRYTRESARRFCDATPQHPSCAGGGVYPQAELMPEVRGQDVLRFGSGASTAPTIDSTDTLTAILPLQNDANVRVRLLPQSRYRVGDAMQIEVQADQSGLMLVFDVDGDGVLRQLYPGPDYSTEDIRPDGRPSGWLRAGHTLTMPDAYSGSQWIMREPLGSGTIVAILAEDYSSIVPLVPDTRAFQATERPQAWLGELSAALNQMIIPPSGNAPAREPNWSIGVAQYTLQP